MKKLVLLIAVCIFTSSQVSAKQAGDWSVQSIEKQQEKTIAVMTKSAVINLASQSKQDSLTAESDVLAIDPVKVRQKENAKTLIIRPYVNTLDQRFWLYDAWISFHTDDDRDGFYNHFTLEFDADTEFDHAQVYARLYLAKGEVFKEYHTTSNFNIYADNNNDSFVVESELLTGFPAADYEVLIELYDANSNQLVATLDGFNDADLYLLPLESEDYEEVYVDQVVVIHESGGSLAWLILFFIPVAIVRIWIK
ncbi:choice-of-anchor H family protein [Paraglaciecola sp. L3A3]|uniref:choice-of-anchor H family protein n=1 Tax=Paraglaciecola sp. L3A3 TaxID=2686358 RepID=UPI00131BD8C8|nr:choice-of-anchor H family protein [Paraglaciecola sp. L3A3]